MLFIKCHNSVCQQGRVGEIGAIAPTFFEVNPIASMMFMEYHIDSQNLHPWV